MIAVSIVLGVFGLAVLVFNRKINKTKKTRKVTAVLSWAIIIFGLACLVFL